MRFTDLQVLVQKEAITIVLVCKKLENLAVGGASVRTVDIWQFFYES